MRIPLTKNFSVQDVQRSEYAAKHHIDNVLPSIYYMNALNVGNNILEPVMAKFGEFFPQSWYRGESLNKAIGGSKKSQHMTASAVDFEIKGHSNLEVAQWIRDNIDFDQLILERHTPGDPYSGWVHCSWSKENNRKECLRYNGKEYLKGLE